MFVITQVVMPILPLVWRKFLKCCLLADIRTKVETTCDIMNSKFTHFITDNL